MLSLVGIAALLFGIIEGPERGWTDVVVLATFVVAVVFIVGFVLWERRAPHPMLPMSFFADRRFSVGSAVVTTTFALLFGFFFSFTLYLQFARGYSPLDAGLASLPSAVVLVIVSSRSAAIAERLGSGRAMALGFVLIGIGMVVFTQVGVDTPYLVLRRRDGGLRGRRGGGDGARDGQHHERRAARPRPALAPPSTTRPASSAGRWASPSSAAS